MLIINQWYGRTGNNLLQIIRAIHYAKMKNHKEIVFMKHHILLSQKIIIETDEQIQEKIYDSFFYLSKFKMNDPSPIIMKSYFQKYIKPILLIKINDDSIDKTSLYIHVRGGDIFSQNPHNAYVQPPLIYYKKIMRSYANIQLICEDKKNPCVNELLKLDNVKYTSNTIENDLYILSNISHLVIGFGTFGFLIYLMNTKLKHLYIPDYYMNSLPKGEWGEDIQVHFIDLPNYIKVGDWKNSDEQRNIMLTYDLFDL